jgi:hypothetical protein
MAIAADDQNTLTIAAFAAIAFARCGPALVGEPMSEHPEPTYAVLGLVDKLPGSSGYELAGVAAKDISWSGG